MEKGNEEPYKSVYKKVLEIRGEIVEVTYTVIDGVVRKSDAWVK